MALEEYIVRQPYPRHSLRRPIEIDGAVAYVVGPDGTRATIDAEDVWVVDGRNWDIQPGAQRYFKRLHVNPTTGRRRIIFMHRLIMRAPPGAIVDHINRNPLDNRKANLRFVTARENYENSDARKRSRERRSERSATITVVGNARARFVVRGYFGSFDTREEADVVAASIEKALEGRR